MKMKMILLLLVPAFAMAQKTPGVVNDALTGKPVPYVNIWIENEDNGTMADSLGQYTVKTTNASKTLVFSAAGYQTKRVKLPETRGLKLAPIQFTPDTLPKLQTKTQTLGADFKIKNSDLTYGSYGKPWMIARKFNPPVTVSRNPILKELKLYTDCHNNNMKLSLRFFEIGADGNPGKELLDRLVIFRVDRGRDETKVDLLEYNIRFPENGIFVAVSWLIISQNVKVWYDKRPMKYKDYDPGIGAKPSDENSTCQYRSGKWQPIGKFPEDYAMREYRGKFPELAMQLTLSN